MILCMDKFIEQHADRISGTLGCFDRVLFRGYLPIMSGAAMAAFLKGREVWGETLKSFLLVLAARLKRHALDLCTKRWCLEFSRMRPLALLGAGRGPALAAAEGPR